MQRNCNVKARMPSQHFHQQVSLVFFLALTRGCSLFCFAVLRFDSHVCGYPNLECDYPVGSLRLGCCPSGSDYTYALSIVPRIEKPTCTSVPHDRFSPRILNRFSTNCNSLMHSCFFIVVVTPSQLQFGKHSTCAETGQSTNQQTSIRNHLTLSSSTSSSWLQNYAAQRNRRADLAHRSCPMPVSAKSLL
jgi:hypothetical protein